MTFFIVAGRALKQWLFFWDIYKLPSKWAKYRATFGFMTVTFLWVSGSLFYFKGYLPYQNIVYPSLLETKIDIGTVERQKKGWYLLTKKNGETKKLEYSYIYDLFEDKYRQQGSLDNPKLFVKIWWFPMTNMSRGWIAQVEKDGQIVISYEEQKKEFMRLADPSDFIIIEKFLFAIFLVLFLWEYLSQYITYRQEHNVLGSSE